MNAEIEKLYEEYFDLMNRQQMDEKDLDYALLEKHRQFLTYMSQVDNSAITIFDLHKREHVFASYNFNNLFGYNLNEVAAEGNDYFNSRVHPEDFVVLLKSGIRALEYMLSVAKEKRTFFKVINEYRIRNAANQYVRVIEQHQTLELDKRGNVWLSLGIIDLSPNQDSGTSVRTQMVNFKTGNFIQFPSVSTPIVAQRVRLSAREKEVLAMIKEGLLSKEISEKLYISVHTVNTHRQNILEKLNANNSQEAIKYAVELGLFY